MGVAISAVIGGPAAGIVIFPDISRFARSVNQGRAAAVMSYGIGMPVILLSVGVTAIAAGEKDLVLVMQESRTGNSSPGVSRIDRVDDQRGQSLLRVYISFIAAEEAALPLRRVDRWRGRNRHRIARTDGPFHPVPRYAGHHCSPDRGNLCHGLLPARTEVRPWETGFGASHQTGGIAGMGDRGGHGLPQHHRFIDPDRRPCL